jgi:large subunit ribosomal protein L9
MEVILRDHVEKLGRRGDVVKVADGYARNYLLPRKLALPATPGNMKVVERQRKIADAADAAERAGADALAARLAQAECVLARRVGEHDTLYGSVTAADIAEELAGKGFDIDKRKIQLTEPIKQIGEFSVGIKLHRDVVAQVPVKVTPLAEATEA